MVDTSTRKSAKQHTTKVARAAAPTRRLATAAEPRKAVGGSSHPESAAKRIDEKFARLGDWRGKRLAEIRRLIHEVDPDVVEECKWMGSPVWSHNGIYAVANAHKGKVKVTFSHGARLADPKKLFNAGLDGNAWRAIDLREGDTIDTAGLKALLREAVAYNVAHSLRRGRLRTGHPLREAEPKGASGTAMRSTANTSRDHAVPAKTRLLAGGNPQIAKAEGDAPVRAYIAAMPGWKRRIGRRLDALISRSVPGVRKAVKWNSPLYGLAGRGWFLGLHCFTKYIKVSFFRGASLHPPPPGESKDPQVRYLDIHEDRPLDEKLLASWIRQAAKLPGWVP